MEDTSLSTMFANLTAEDSERHPPFRWQMRLLHRLLDTDAPRVVDIPTGLGKTAVMALWLIALAEGARLPRRLVYVVDRRAVVDQATRFAERLRSNMPGELAEGLGLEAGERLPISTLRGGFADNRDWLEDPSKPAIVVGTIDMVGSRLLFEGYGVSKGMRPYHAGLLGVDALVLLDEAHLCPPFEALLRQVESRGGGKLGSAGDSDSIAPPFRLMSLSATGRDDLSEASLGAVFALEAEDREEPEVGQRLLARKRLKVTELDAGTNLAESLAERAVEVGCAAPASRVLVCCDRRRDAVEVKGLIDKECRRRRHSGELAEEHASELLVGERRVRERVDLERWLDKRGFLGAARERPPAPGFLVATSAGEVGVDLNADHMVCDLVAYERMVQRLGRVNRRGGADRQATIDVLALPPESKDKAPKDAKARAESDYRARLDALRRLPEGEDGRRDASPAAIVEVKAVHPDVVRAATTRPPLHPELTRPLLDAWSMTSLRHHEGRPEVAPWLRGWEDDDERQTSVVWRKYLPCVHTGGETNVPPSMVAEYFRVAPVHATERLEAASSRVFDWMLRRVAQVAKRPQGHESAIGDDEIVVIAIDRAGEHRAHLTLRELRLLSAPAKSFQKAELRQRNRRKGEWRNRHLPGATLVTDQRLCGVRDGMLDEKCEAAAETADAEEFWRAMKDPAAEERPLIGFLVERVDGGEDNEGLRCPDRGEWRHVRTFETSIDAAGAVRSGLGVFKWPDDSSDEESRSVLSAPQSLRQHEEQVAEHALALAQRLELAEDEADALVTAARLHDDGKAAERWQNAMNAPRDEGRPYAKTRGGGNPSLLEGYRHEFGSLLKAERLDLPNDTRDLVLHLIAAHHGNARPTLSPMGCDDGPPSVLESRAGDAAVRFARLQRRYGPWGLAWREALLRAADQSASRAWSKRHEEGSRG
ncbi:MAG: type I-U CRISPR-associated helicase/endonuclease Cas3 [Thiotrichales bacterium]|nr:type I-U CRISPR-associated helicase/endonuclease Cas3 [Thiotrichales bacterium]